MSDDEAVTAGPDTPTDASPAPRGGLARPPLHGQGGSYRLISPLGHGGFAEVFLAEQTAPVRRRVALKLLRGGIESAAVLARFEVERQALALMDHPNVAKVFDAGTAWDGAPYFVMEHVPGVPITEHCDLQRLRLEARLLLFLQTCAAIRHAHQKGVIHRDVKPSNVLVAVDGDVALVKVIDFGVAKAVGPRLTDRTLVTELGQLIGTPEYMSPEQVEMTAQDIDTRADVYGLGVLLYELLTGSLPLARDRLAGAPYAEVLRAIREDEPPRPSARVASLGADAVAVAAARRTDPQCLARDLRGDLDWIAAKALAKDRTARYGTVAELAADVERHLRNEAVSAGPPSAAYHLRKFVRRNRVAVLGAVALVLALVAGAVSTALFAARESRARAVAEAESLKARAAVGFLEKMLRAADPEAAGRDVRVLDVVATAADDLEAGAVADPQVEATIRTALGATYLGLGRLEDAERHLRRGFEIRRSLLGTRHPETADSLVNLGWLAFTRDDSATAERLLRESLDVYRTAAGPHDPRLANTLHDLALVLTHQGRVDDAEAAYRESLRLSEASPRVDVVAVALTRSRLGSLLATRGRLGEAEGLQRQALAVLAPEADRTHVRAVDALAGLASVLQQAGRPRDAVAAAEQAVRLSSQRHGEDAPTTAQTLVTLASAHRAAGQPALAEGELRRALAIYTAAYGEGHSFVATTLDHLAGVLDDLGRVAEAAALYPRAIALHEATYGPAHWLVGNARGRYGLCLLRTGREAEATGELQAAYEVLAAAGFTERAAPIAARLAALFEARGHTVEARLWRDRATAPRARTGN